MNILSNFKWYRKWRGGVWYFNRRINIYGKVFYNWERNKFNSLMINSLITEKW